MTTSTSIRINLCLAGLVVVAAAAAGCGGSDDAKTPSVTAAAPKSAPAANPGDISQPASPPAPASTPSRDSAVNPDVAAGTRMSAGGVSWEMPPGWSDAGEKPMRLATISDGQAEIAITSFPGAVGGIVANVNRWCDQVGLPRVNSEAEAEKLMTDVDVDGRKVRVVDLSGNARMLVAIVPGDDKLYFFKMTGPQALIAGRKDAFDRIVRSVKVQ